MKSLNSFRVFTFIGVKIMQHNDRGQVISWWHQGTGTMCAVFGGPTQPEDAAVSAHLLYGLSVCLHRGFVFYVS